MLRNLMKFTLVFLRKGNIMGKENYKQRNLSMKGNLKMVKSRDSVKKFTPKQESEWLGILIVEYFQKGPKVASLILRSIKDLNLRLQTQKDQIWRKTSQAQAGFPQIRFRERLVILVSNGTQGKTSLAFIPLHFHHLWTNLRHEEHLLTNRK